MRMLYVVLHRVNPILGKKNITYQICIFLSVLLPKRLIFHCEVILSQSCPKKRPKFFLEIAKCLAPEQDRIGKKTKIVLSG